jgi:hypothetical protein
VRRIPHSLAVPVSHKTGDGGAIANEAAITYAHAGPVVMTVFADAIAGSYAEAEDRIGRMAQEVVARFDSPR